VLHTPTLFVSLRGVEGEQYCTKSDPLIDLIPRHATHCLTPQTRSPKAQWLIH